MITWIHAIFTQSIVRNDACGMAWILLQLVLEKQLFYFKILKQILFCPFGQSYPMVKTNQFHREEGQWSIINLSMM